MAAAADTAPPDTAPRRDREVPLWRLYLMRAIALLFVVGGFSNYLPGLLDPSPTARGMTISMLGGLWVLAFVVLRYPLLMLPIYLFEFVWKTVWLLAFGLPQWTAGRVDPQLNKDLWEIGLFPFVFALIIPWGYFWRHYVRAPAERWRWGASREPAPPIAPAGRDHEVSLARLSVLRGMFLVFAILGFFVHVPWLIDPEPDRRGMLDSMLAGLWILSFLGVRYPLQLLPIFLFEFLWKTIWLLAFGLPQWMAGRTDPQLAEDIWMIGLGPIVFGLLIPWTYVWRHYVREPTERWR